MLIAILKAHIAAYAAAAGALEQSVKDHFERLAAYAAAAGALEQSVKDHFERLVAYVEGEEAKVKAEIEHLTGLGYTVAPPAQPAAVVASTAPAGSETTPAA